jgi:hypothetical protein
MLSSISNWFKTIYEEASFEGKLLNIEKWDCDNVLQNIPILCVNLDVTEYLNFFKTNLCSIWLLTNDNTNLQKILKEHIYKIPNIINPELIKQIKILRDTLKYIYSKRYNYFSSNHNPNKRHDAVSIKYSNIDKLINILVDLCIENKDIESFNICIDFLKINYYNIFFTKYSDIEGANLLNDENIVLLFTNYKINYDTTLIQKYMYRCYVDTDDKFSPKLITCCGHPTQQHIYIDLIIRYRHLEQIAKKFKDIFLKPIESSVLIDILIKLARHEMITEDDFFEYIYKYSSNFTKDGINLKKYLSCHELYKYHTKFGMCCDVDILTKHIEVLENRILQLENKNI